MTVEQVLQRLREVYQTADDIPESCVYCDDFGRRCAVGVFLDMDDDEIRDIQRNRLVLGDSIGEIFEYQKVHPSCQRIVQALPHIEGVNQVRFWSVLQSMADCTRRPVKSVEKYLRELEWWVVKERTREVDM